MKRFREQDNFEEINSNLSKDEMISDKNDNEVINQDSNEENSKSNISYKRLEDEKESDFITTNMKKFRTIIGGIILVSIAYTMMFSGNSGAINYLSNIESGKIEGIEVGDRISEESIKLEPKDLTIESVNGYGKLELSIWNFSQKEDGDYVQVFVNGAPHTEPFVIRHRPTKVGVPDDAVIKVKGIRDGGNNGITYGVFFNKTGETYLNTVPLNSSNTYTLKAR